jgi:hypothetical protein
MNRGRNEAAQVDSVLPADGRRPARRSGKIPRFTAAVNQVRNSCREYMMWPLPRVRDLSAS